VLESIFSFKLLTVESVFLLCTWVGLKEPSTDSPSESFQISIALALNSLCSLFWVW